ncbi:MAG: TrmH family RNA methyltransferase [Candidatus Falkowbacteria bacterium]|nr:MAG: TrmH family RNA methyltransferase [Candidatus Falkowbacteria bacterium]
MTLNSRELRKIPLELSEKIKKERAYQPLYIVLEDVLDTYNIGGFFRLAEAIGASKLYLCGGCATPPDTKITKASVGAYQLVPWEYKASTLEAIAEIRKIKKIKIIAVEQTPQAVDYRSLKYKFPLAFIFGNETAGLKNETLSLVDGAVEVPMYGINKSLNVMVAAGIVLYKSLEKLRKK